MDFSLTNIDFEPLTEVKAKLSEKVALVGQKGRLLVLTVNGKPKAVLAPYSEFLALVETQKTSYTPRRLSFSQWEKESKTRKAVSESIKSLFDVDSLSRKGQKPYKRDALKKIRKP